MKIGKYIKLMHKIELIRMIAHFLVDDFGQVWFAKASDIWVREMNEFPTDYSKMFS
jgi:hypothetical protein